MSTRWLPLSTVMAQPPLTEAAGFKLGDEAEVESAKIDPYDTSPKDEDALLCGTDRWCSFPIDAYVRRARGCWVKVHEPGKGDEGATRAAEQPDRYWPQDVRPWSIGAWMEDTEMIVPTPLEWKL